LQSVASKFINGLNIVGISIQRSRLNSCLLMHRGRGVGQRHIHGQGCLVTGCTSGGSGSGRSGRMLYQWSHILLVEYEQDFFLRNILTISCILLFISCCCNSYLRPSGPEPVNLYIPPPYFANKKTSCP
jgi:hypothetical protein